MSKLKYYNTLLKVFTHFKVEASNTFQKSLDKDNKTEKKMYESTQEKKHLSAYRVNLHKLVTYLGIKRVHQ